MRKRTKRKVYPLTNPIAVALDGIAIVEQEKLDKLLVFYRKVMPEAGWDRYRRIDLEYNGQIVCQRR